MESWPIWCFYLSKGSIVHSGGIHYSLETILEMAHVQGEHHFLMFTSAIIVAILIYLEVFMLCLILWYESWSFWPRVLSRDVRQLLLCSCFREWWINSHMHIVAYTWCFSWFKFMIMLHMMLVWLSLVHIVVVVRVFLVGMLLWMFLGYICCLLLLIWEAWMIVDVHYFSTMIVSPIFVF